jgi:hypothetical protein
VGLATGITAPADDALIRPWGQLTVYAVEGGARFVISSQAELDALPYASHAVLEIPGSGLVWIGTIPRDGTLVRERDQPAVWWINGGQRHIVPDPATLSARFPGQTVRIIPAGTVGQIPIGAPVPPIQCTVTVVSSPSFTPTASTEADDRLVVQNAGSFATNPGCTLGAPTYQWSYEDGTVVQQGGFTYDTGDDDVGHDITFTASVTSTAPGSNTGSGSASTQPKTVFFNAGFVVNQMGAKAGSIQALDADPIVANLLFGVERVDGGVHHPVLRFDLWYYDPAKVGAGKADAAQMNDDVAKIAQIRATVNAHPSTRVLVTFRESALLDRPDPTTLGNSFRAFVADLFLHHALATSGATAFEVWNEPNYGGPKSQGAGVLSADWYAAVLKAVVPYLHSLVDANGKPVDKGGPPVPGGPWFTVAGSLQGYAATTSPNYPSTYLRAVLKAAPANARPNAISLHPYEPAGSLCAAPGSNDGSDTGTASMDRLKAVVADLYKVTDASSNTFPFIRNIWITEFAYAGWTPPQNGMCSEAQQKTRVTQMFSELALKVGKDHPIKRLYWFEVEDEGDDPTDPNEYHKTGLLYTDSEAPGQTAPPHLKLCEKAAAAAWRARFGIPDPPAGVCPRP